MRIQEAPQTTLVGSSRLFQAFADPVRLRILHLLSGADEVCVCHLHEALDLPQPTVSRHLATLRSSGLVATRKAGLWVHYRMARPDSPLHWSLLSALAAMGADDTLIRDRRRLESLRACPKDPPGQVSPPVSD